MPRRGEPSADLDSVVTEISQQVRLLDGLVRPVMAAATAVGLAFGLRGLQLPVRPLVEG